MNPSQDGLYHQLLGFPADALTRLLGRTFKLQYSGHARSACRNDRYGFIIPPRDVTVKETEVVELEVSCGKTTKLVLRLPYTSTLDVVLALLPEGENAFVKTVWLNKRDDGHRTLNRAAYRKP